MNATLYRPDGEKLTLQETLQCIIENDLVNNPPDRLHPYGDFNDRPNGLVHAIESAHFDLSGLDDALGLLVSDSLLSLKTSDEIIKLLTAYAKSATPSAIIQERITVRIAQWAQQHVTDIAEFKGFYGF